MLIDFGTRGKLHISTPKPFDSLHNLGSKCSTKSLSFFKTKSVVSLILRPVTVPPERAVAVRIVVGWKRTVSSASPPTLLRIDKSDATENGKDGFPVENLVEKIAAIRERRQRNEDMLARNSIGPERARSRSPTPTAERWRRIRALRWVTTCQIAVDAKHKLLVEQQVANQVVDMDLLAQTVEPAHQS